MRAWVGFVIIIAMGAAVYFGFIKFDPFSFVMLCILLYQTHVLMQRQQQQVDAYSKMHAVLTKNQKVILDEVKAVRADLRKK